MEKRVVVFFLISVAILASWYFIFPPPKAPPPSETPPVAAQNDQPKTPAPAAAPGVPGGAAAAPLVPSEPEQKTTFERAGLYRAVFSNVDAAPVEFTLLDKQYKVAVDDKDVPIELIKKEAGRAPYLTAFRAQGAENERSDFDLPPGTVWRVVRAGDEGIVYATDVGPIHVEKRWRVPHAGYQLELEVTVDNKGEKPAQARLVVDVDGYHDPNVKPAGMSFGKRVNFTEGLCDVEGKLKNQGLEESQKKPLTEVGDVKWVGYGEHFFLVAAALVGDGQPRTCQIAGQPNGRIEARAIYGARTIPPGGRQAWPVAAYLGPKSLELLDRVTVPGFDGKPGDARLSDALNYRVLGIDLEIPARAMLWTLKKLHWAVGNWGVAIILITILLKLVTLYPTQKSMKSMKAMARLKPEIDRIKERFPDDKNRQNSETMALYKKHNVSMFGGCLPMLLQMPIYMAFYAMLSNAVELYRASFVWPFPGMTDSFPPLAIVTGILMFVQQRTSPQAADPQQKTMMYMMPVMFMAFTAMLPSGLTLYIFTNTLLTMLHQLWMNRNDPDKRKAKAPGKTPKPVKA